MRRDTGREEESGDVGTPSFGSNDYWVDLKTAAVVFPALVGRVRMREPRAGRPRSEAFDECSGDKGQRAASFRSTL